MDELRARLAANAQDYDAYVQLLHSSDLPPTEANAVRRQFHQNFPLDEETWLAWLRDSNNEEEDLYEACLHDYLSPALHVAYVERQWTKLSPEHMRQVYAKHATQCCGWHYTRGHLLFQSWIAYEKQQGADTEQVVIPMRWRATSPLEHVKEYWQEFADQFPQESSEAAQAHAEALAVAERMAPQEHVLRECRESNDECAGSPTTAANTKLEKEWLNHLWMEQQPQHQGGRSSRLVVLFERAIGDCCLSQRVWHMYLRFIDQHQQQAGEDVAATAYLRATRNVPSLASAWAGRIRLLLLGGDDAAAVKAQALAWWRLAVDNNNSGDDDEALLEPAMMVLRRFPDALEDVLEVGVAPATAIQLLLLPLAGGNRKRNWERIHQLAPVDDAMWMEHVREEASAGAGEGRQRELYMQALASVKSNARAVDVVGSAWVRFEFTHMSSSSSSSVLAYNRAVDMVAKRKRECARGGGGSSTSAVAVAAVAAPTKHGQRPKAEVEPPAAAPHKKQQQKPPPVEAAPAAAAAVSEPAVKRVKQQQEDNDDAQQPHEVFIGALPSSAANKDVLRAFFSNRVKVDDAFVKMVHVGHRKDGSSYAHVTFGGVSHQAAVKAAAAACQLSGAELDGMSLKILLSRPPPPAASKPAAAATPADKPKPKPTSFLPRSVAAKKPPVSS